MADGTEAPPSSQRSRYYYLVVMKWLRKSDNTQPKAPRPHQSARGSGPTFDPRQCADRLRDAPLRRVPDRAWVEAPESYFTGDWEARHLLNTPGPFYGAETDTCCDGPPLAPNTLLYDDTGAGFVWRQPRDEAETLALMTGASSDPFSGYAWDGDEHWTPDLVRAWWDGRHEQQAHVNRLITAVAGPRPELKSDYEDLLFRCLPVGGYAADERARMLDIVGAFLEYRLDGMKSDLQRYIFFLERHRYPDTDEKLPAL